MSPHEIEECLSTFEIVVDSREQPSERAKRRYKSFGCPYSRHTLNYGDYTYNFILPDGRKLYSGEETIFPDVVIERKMDLVELSGCFTQSRKRFAAEFQRATEHGATVYLLVENATWENLINGKYNTRFNPVSFFASLTAFIARYKLRVLFCKSETSGVLIKQILYRELKEKLEGGAYG